MIKFGLLTLIRMYQQTGELRSWLFSPMCRFYPSCSTYAGQAIERHGSIRGSGYAIWRVLRCHPGSRGGVDPVPS